MDFINLLLLISVSQGFLFGFAILFSPFYKSQINNYLGYSILILASLMLNVYLETIGIFIKYPKFKVLYDIEWIFLFPVFFFLYFLKSINHVLGKSKRLYTLYIPFLLSVILNITYNLEYVYEWFASSWKYKELFYKWIFNFQELAYYSFNFIIAGWSYNILKKEKYTTHPNSKWLQNLCIWICSLITSWIIIDIVDMFFNIGYEIGISIICMGASLYIYWVVYYGIYTLKLTNTNQGDIVNRLENNDFQRNSIEIINEIKGKNLSVSSISFSENNKYFQKLEIILQKDCIYRDPNLNQEKVAKLLNISSGYLSQIVNEVTKKNFAIYINSYRVKEVKSMILNIEFDKYSLLAIGLEAGFKSKTTFYTSFKKETGLTPSQFRSKNKKVLNS